MVFDNSDYYFLEPEEEVKYRLVIYTTIETQEEDPMVSAVLLLPSLVLIGVGGYGLWRIRGRDLLAALPVLMPRPLAERGADRNEDGDLPDEGLPGLVPIADDETGSVDEDLQ